MVQEGLLLTSQLGNAVLIDKLVRAAAAAAAARACDVGAAVQNDLNGGQEVGLLALGVELPPVSKRRHRAVSPAGAAVLWDVLVEVLGAVVDAADVAPVE